MTFELFLTIVGAAALTHWFVYKVLPVAEGEV